MRTSAAAASAVWIMLLVMTGSLVERTSAHDAAPFMQTSTDATPEATAAADRSALAQHLTEIEESMSRIRELEPLNPITRRFPTRAELEAFLISALDEQLDAETAFREAQFYAAFDFLPAGVDLRQLYLDLLTAQVAGFYDPETEVMNVILIGGGQPRELLPLLERITYAHEYVHALQDQHFGLREIGFDPQAALDNPDRTLAVQALIEGDATLAMNDYAILVTQANPLAAALQLLVQGAQVGGLTLPPGTPEILEQELLFPYFTGLTFVQALHREGGWARINQAYSDLPQSSEQILHPDRYLEGDAPQEVTLDAVALGAGWEKLLDRTLGEFYLQQYLRTQLETLDALAAAAGWDGDRYQIYYNAATSQRAWALRIVWDTPEDAAEFAEAFAEFGAARFPDVAPQGGCWAAAEEVLCMMDDEGASAISYAPSLDLAQRLLASAALSPA